MEGQIVKILSNLYFVEDHLGKIHECRSRGKFRALNITPVVGDFVRFDEKENYILEIEKRKNVLIRPMVANIDQAFIVTSVKNPDFQDYLLDKLLTLMHYYHITPVICITKYDLLTKEEKKKIKPILKYYRTCGYSVVMNSHLFRIKRMFRGKTTVFTGQTGAGKSTLLNRLDASLHLETGEISLALGRGKHTTRHVELIHLFRGKVLDTPGFSSLELKDLTNEDIQDAFLEFSFYSCPFADCHHLNEKECEVKKQVNNGKILSSRYENYRRFMKEK